MSRYHNELILPYGLRERFTHLALLTIVDYHRLKIFQCEILEYFCPLKSSADLFVWLKMGGGGFQ